MNAYRVTFVLALVDLVLEINRTKEQTSIRPETRATLLRSLNDLSKQLQTLQTKAPSPAESTSEPRGIHKAAGQQVIFDKATRIDPAYTFPAETSEVPSVSHDDWTRPPVAPCVAPIAGVGSTATYSQLSNPGSYPQGACTQQNFLHSSDTLPPSELVGNYEFSTSDGRSTTTRSGCSRPLQSDIGGPGQYRSYHNTASSGHPVGGVTYRAVISSNNSVTVTPFRSRGSRFPFNVSQYANIPEHDGSREAEIGPRRTNRGHSAAAGPYSPRSHLRCHLPNCDRPDYEFWSAHELVRHQESARAHSVSYQQCPVCEKDMSRTDAVKRHVRNKHPAQFLAYYRE
ncbi:hypothetical protein ACEPAI_6640 [Sanghuangporus weigelae]